jgi:hypothetical protein
MGVIALAVAPVFALTGPSSTARAALMVRLTQPGFGQTIVIDVAGPNPSASFSGTFGDFSIDIVNVSANTPGLAGLAQLAFDTITVQNNSQLTRTLVIDIGATDFTQPIGPVTLSTEVSAVLRSANGAGTVVFFESHANPDNGQFSTSGPSTGVLALNLPAPNVVVSASSQVAAVLPPGPYSLTDPITMTMIGLSRLELIDPLTVTPAAAVPEPATLTCAVAGLVSFGAYRFRGRKRPA